ncbi:MAG TPA: class I SAM-dependent methyltransferase, partial [Thermoplasmata archaeon]|nr:class I SAM-dependent methyltransferase [Thermoplasmata archaeon]
GWFSSEIAAAFLGTMTPLRFGDWLTDRRARRPSGRQAEATYRDPLFHRPNFLAILEALRLTPQDYLLEVGCGGGAFMHDALRSGCRASAVDHSPEMVRLASAVNRTAINAGRLTIAEAEADRLPVPSDTFSCAVMTGVFGFIHDPGAALREIHRALRDGGRLVLFTGTSALRGTPAAPEPMASRIHFYDDAELVRLAKDAGFGEARVERPNLEPHARVVGIPKEAIPLFRGTEGQLLIARK